MHDKATKDKLTTALLCAICTSLAAFEPGLRVLFGGTAFFALACIDIMVMQVVNKRSM